MNRLIYPIVLLLILAGCNAHPTSPAGGTPKLDSSANAEQHQLKLYDSAYDRLKVTVLEQLIIHDTLFPFSSADTYDTFRLIINAGPVKDRNASFIIKPADGLPIYQQSFSTQYFT